MWSDACQEAFVRDKALLTAAPILMAPWLERHFNIQLDASKVGAGAVSLQEDDSGIECPVCFFLWKFMSYQLNDSTIEKEALTLVWALQHEVYVGGSGSPVVLYNEQNLSRFSIHFTTQTNSSWGGVSSFSHII